MEEKYSKVQASETNFTVNSNKFEFLAMFRRYTDLSQVRTPFGMLVKHIIT